MTVKFAQNALETTHQAIKQALKSYAPGCVYGADQFTGKLERAITYRLYMLNFGGFEDGLPQMATARFQVTLPRV